MSQSEVKKYLKPDEYFLPDNDDGSWYHQSQLEEQEQEDAQSLG